MIQRCGFYSPAWDFSAGPALVRAHFLAFSATHGWGLGEGDIPVSVWMLPDYQDPQLLKEMQEYACAEMLKEGMAVVGSSAKPIAVDMGRTLKCKVGTTVRVGAVVGVVIAPVSRLSLRPWLVADTQMRTLPDAWMNEPQQFKVCAPPC